jgi:hypothetical protein
MAVRRIRNAKSRDTYAVVEQLDTGHWSAEPRSHTPGSERSAA